MSAYFSLYLTITCAIFIFTNSEATNGFIFFIVAFVILYIASGKIYTRFVAVVAVFFIAPLFFIHGVLNSNYEVTHRVADFVPVRGEGIVFAASIASKMLIFFAASIYWLNTQRSDFIRLLLRVRFPDFLMRIILQSFVVATSIETRASRIILAQKARGIDIRSSWRARFRSLPAILIPLVVWLFKEAKTRARIQDYTGSCNVHRSHVGAPKNMTVKEIFGASILFALTLYNAVFGITIG